MAIKSCYADLFALYPDAAIRDPEAIASWIRANTDYRDDSVRRAVRTFMTLCSAAIFDGAPVTTPGDAAAWPASGAATPTAVLATPIMAAPNRPGITINIELQIPATTDAAVYENFFAAMSKHLKLDGS